MCGPALPVRQVRRAVAFDAPTEADGAVGLEPDEHRLEPGTTSRTRAHTLHEQEVRRGQAVPLGIPVVFPVPSPVCRPLTACERGQDLVVQVDNSLFQAVPAGAHVVHVQDVCAGEVLGQGGGEVRLARAAGSVDRDDPRRAATRLGLADGQECRGDRLIPRCEVHVWTVDSQGLRRGAR